MSEKLELLGAVGVAIVTTVLGPIAFEYIKGKIFKPKKTKDSIGDEIRETAIITEELLMMREVLDADRIWITQFHNGGHYLNSKKSIQKFSITFEDVRPGVSSARHLVSNIPISLQARAMSHILDEGFLFIPNFADPNAQTYGLKPMADATGSEASFILGLTDIATNKCIGTLGIDYREPKTLTPQQEEFFVERGNRLAGFISVFLQNK